MDDEPVILCYCMWMTVFLTGEEEKLITECKTESSPQSFEMKDLGLMSLYPSSRGMAESGKRISSLNQGKYIDRNAEEVRHARMQVHE
jgi:hypothetical protein